MYEEVKITNPNHKFYGERGVIAGPTPDPDTFIIRALDGFEFEARKEDYTLYG